MKTHVPPLTQHHEYRMFESPATGLIGIILVQWNFDRTFISHASEWAPLISELPDQASTNPPSSDHKLRNRAALFMQAFEKPILIQNAEGHLVDKPSAKPEPDNG